MVEQIPGKVSMEKLVSLSQRRGFIFPSSEIYGGLSSCWDYGPMGAELKRNIKEAWWRSVVQEREDMVGLDTSILMHPKVWEASGHLEGFSEPLVECFRYLDLLPRDGTDSLDHTSVQLDIKAGPIRHLDDPVYGPRRVLFAPMTTWHKFKQVLNQGAGSLRLAGHDVHRGVEAVPVGDDVHAIDRG